MKTRSMATVQEGDSGVQDREELRARLELAEARTKRNEDLLAAIAAKLGIGTEGQQSGGAGSQIHQEFGENRSKEKWRKLEIPVFNGEDAFGWTHRLERFFDFKGVDDGEKMQGAVLALEGRAMSWFQRWEKC